MQICYVITNPAWPDYVKIGFTSKNDIKSRLRTYQTGTPFRDYEVYHEVLFEDARKAEAEVQKRLKEMNATRSGNTEWYKMSKRIAANMIDGVFDDLQEEE